MVSYIRDIVTCFLSKRLHDAPQQCACTGVQLQDLAICSCKQNRHHVKLAALRTSVFVACKSGQGLSAFHTSASGLSDSVCTGNGRARQFGPADQLAGMFSCVKCRQPPANVLRRWRLLCWDRSREGLSKPYLLLQSLQCCGSAGRCSDLHRCTSGSGCPS